jgi:hypothetical protein
MLAYRRDAVPGFHVTTDVLSYEAAGSPLHPPAPPKSTPNGHVPTQSDSDAHETPRYSPPESPPELHAPAIAGSVALIVKPASSAATQSDGDGHDTATSFGWHGGVP